MDPKQALLDALQYLASGKHHDAKESLEHYWTWINKGGFEPSFTGTELASAIDMSIDLKDVDV